MNAVPQALLDHMKTGHTSVCRAWSLSRLDGVILGFTDHDGRLEFGGLVFEANSGLTAMALQQTTGLSVDNTEAVGVLNHAAITESDIDAGRYDGAVVKSWLVNWQDTEQRMLQFSGYIGDISRTSVGFTAELRGLSDRLNQPHGRVFQKPCSAVLGDRSCQFDMATPGFFAELQCEEVVDNRFFHFETLAGFADGWFERGVFEVTSGAAKGLMGIVKNDRSKNGSRIIELWEPVRAKVVAGDLLRLEAGCDKRKQTCQIKFENYLNFQGFPDIPGEDWLTSVPVQSALNDGGSLGS